MATAQGRGGQSEADMKNYPDIGMMIEAIGGAPVRDEQLEKEAKS